MVELMSPAGSYETLAAAIKAGAESIYFGVEHLNMRARSANFQLKDLPKIAKICQKNNVKSYLTLNTVMYDEDLSLVHKICDKAKAAKISAIIAHDVAVMTYAKSIGLEVHLSTQANVSNIEAVKFYAQFADVIVLARELTLTQIKKIIIGIKKQKIKGPSGKLVQIELFIHGALCVSIAGKCYMSLASHNFSANRGACVQTCRRAYRVIDEANGQELFLENKYVMSPKDLCTIGVLDQIIKAEVAVLKIEGRARGPEYVYTTTKVYREAIDSVEKGTYTPKRIKDWTKELETVFNRGFWQGGYYLGNKLGEWSGTYGSKATLEKVYLGKVINYYHKAKVAAVKIENGLLKVGDQILITGPTTGVVKTMVKEMMLEETEIKTAKKMMIVTLPLNNLVRINDKVYVLAAKD